MESPALLRVLSVISTVPTGSETRPSRVRTCRSAFISSVAVSLGSSKAATSPGTVLSCRRTSDSDAAVASVEGGEDEESGEDDKDGGVVLSRDDVAEGDWRVDAADSSYCSSSIELRSACIVPAFIRDWRYSDAL